MIGNNPAFREDTFSGRFTATEPSQAMTMQGTVLKSAGLVGLTVAAAAVSWGISTSGGTFSSQAAMPWMIGGLIVGLIFALITIFKPTAAPFTAPLYAVAEGLFLGAVSAFYEAAFAQTDGNGMFSGIVVQAVALTLGVLLSMLVLYAFRIIRVTKKLRAGIIAATMAVALVYVVSLVMNMFGMTMPYLHSSGPIGIGISLLIIGIAAFNLLLDFDLIERGVQQGAPKYMEWYAGFALLVTLVWLYLEILRLLSKLRSR